MDSRLAVAEKRAARSRGFGGVFMQLFDWNRVLARRKKKLLAPPSGKLLLPSGSKKFGGDEKMPKPKHFLIASEKLEDYPVYQKKNDLHSQIRDPGPIAKLMGLESMPVVQHKQHHKSTLSPEFGSSRYEAPEGKESRPQKLQITGGFMEKQQHAVDSCFEASQSCRRVRRPPHHKLASPVKSPRLLGKRRTARLMEAATKILEPGLQARRDRAKCALTFSWSLHSDEMASKDGFFPKKCRIPLDDLSTGPSRRFYGLNETVELGPMDDETPVKGHNQNKMKHLESLASSPYSPVKVDAERLPVISIARDRPACIDVQAKVVAGSTPRGLYKKKICVQEEHSRKILRQNQIPPVKGKLVFGAKVHNMQPSRRDLAISYRGLSSSAHSKTAIKPHRERMGTEGSGSERKNKAPKRRPNDDSLNGNGKALNFTLEKRQSVRNDLLNGKSKRVISNRSINCSSAKSGFKDNVEGSGPRINRSSINSEIKNHAEGSGLSGSERSDIVSFTFSSPMRHAGRMTSSEDVADRKRYSGKLNCIVSGPKSSASAEKMHRVAVQREGKLRGDSLSTLLGQKLEALSPLHADAFATGDDLEGKPTSFILGELFSEPRHCKEATSSSTNISENTTSCDGKIKSAERFQAEPEGSTSAACLVSNDDHPSPVSILDVSFSNDSCLSGSPHDSSERKRGCDPTGTCNDIQLLDADTDLLDSASSFGVDKPNMGKTRSSLANNSEIGDFSSIHETWFSETKLSYSEEAKSIAQLLIDTIFSTEPNRRDSSVSETLEAITKSSCVTDTGDGDQIRRLLFDCVIECLDSRYNRCFKPGSNNPLLVQRKRLVRAISEEIEGWSSLAGKGMDDLVGMDMRHPNGIWTGFETQAFEAGVQIESAIVDDLVGEITIDLCI